MIGQGGLGKCWHENMDLFSTGGRTRDANRI
jgi:hypothetical protein